MAEHLTRVQIAALLDEPDAVAGGLAHLDVCPDCASEFEGMSRTRMALSGLPDLTAPDGVWARVSTGLPGRPRVPGLRWGLPARWTRPLTAAAILVLFLGGLGVGRMLAPGASPADDAATGPEAIAQGNEGAGGAAPLESDYPEYLRSVAELRELREGGPTADEIAADPALAAERLTRLDALIQASREALRTAPADPALNDFLFEVVDERASVAGRLDQTIRQASMEY